MRLSLFPHFAILSLGLVLASQSCSIRIRSVSGSNETIGPDHFTLSGSAIIAARVCSGPFTFTSKDSSGNDWSVISATTVAISGGLSGAFYSDSGCTSAVSAVNLTAGSSSGTFYYKNALAENLSLSVNSATSLPGAYSVSSQMIAMGDSHGCLAYNGILKCWGAGGSGQLGNGPVGTSNVPFQVPAFASGVTAVSAGGATTCAIVNGAAWCWGDNTNGQLGNGVTGGNSSVPVQVSGLTSGVTAISVGVYHVCAIVNGGAQCWGDNIDAELGTGAAGGVFNTPQQVVGLTSGVTFVSAGNDHSCAVVSGAAMCWGHNDSALASPLGYTSGLPSVPTPTTVTNMASNVFWIQVAGFHGCTITAGGVASCWGMQDVFGQLGNGGLADTYIPSQMTGMGSGVTSLAIGQSNGPGNCLVQNGAAKCWGQNTYGNIGDNSTTPRNVPTQVSGLTSGVIGISTGEDHACALMSSGQVYCWGEGTTGQLGQGAFANSLTPVLAGPF